MRRVVLIALCALATFGPAATAEAYWRAGGSGSGSGSAATMPTANQPSASASARSVTVTWTQSTFQGSRLGSYGGGGYKLKRYAQGSSTAVTPSANCATTISGTTETLQCVEAGVPYGDWQYSATPQLNSFSGGESAKSAAVTVAAPQLSFSSQTTVTSLPTTLSGSISNFASGESVSFRLDNPTTGTVLSGSTSPSPVGTSGGASISVTIPAGTADGAHTVYAIGNRGNTASAAITVQALHHFDFDTIGERHSGKSFVITVRAKDAAGQTITAFNNTAVNLSLNSGTISPSTTNTFTNGVSTQAVTITGTYTTTQTITASGGSPLKTGTSNAFTLHDWKYFFKKTTAYTADANTCTTAYRKRDMAEGYAGSDPEETHNRAGSGTETANFCSPAFAATDKLAAGTTTVNAYIDGPSGSACGISATLYKVSGGVATTLGSATRSITGTSVVLYTYTIKNTATNFAAGDRLQLRFQMDPVKACSESFIHYGGITYRTHVQLPGPGGSAYSDTVFATSGLVSYWRLGETTGTTAADSKNTNHGTYLNGVLLTSASLLANDSDTSAWFDGLDDRVSIPDAPGLDFAGRAPFTLEAWVKPDIVDTNSQRLISKEITTAEGTQGYTLYFGSQTDGGFRFMRRRDGASQATTSGTLNAQASSTHHVVGTYDGTTMRIYVNGTQVGSTTSTLDMLDHANPVALGATSTGGGRLQGFLDEAATYNRALTAAEVQQHYDAR